jgi:hypothetical protein
MHPGQFTNTTVPGRLAGPADPWAGLARHRYALATATSRLAGLRRGGQ